MKISIFWIGVIITIIGITWISTVFVNNNQRNSEILLSPRESQAQEIQLIGKDLGYYKILVSDLNDRIFVQIIDPQGNLISDKKIETKMSVNYFNIHESGIYSIKVTNISDHQFLVKSEFGNTNSEKILYPGIMMLLGMILVFVGFFKKLRNYKTAQPDENNS